MPDRPLHRVAGCLALTMLAVEPALAGPGGRIASAAFETFWGRIALGLLAIVFLPLLIHVYVQEGLAARRARKDLAFVAARSPGFDRLGLRARWKDCFFRVHAGWREGDLSEAGRWMTSWYWQNQQSVSLQAWKAQGLVNVCNVRRIKSMRPLLFVHRNDGAEHEGSAIVVAIEARMQDYLKSEATGKVVEGSKRWKDVETLWTFTYVRGAWLVSDIEEGSCSLAYASTRKELPAIESTVSHLLRV